MSDQLQASLSRMRAAHASDPLPHWPVRADRLRRLEAMLLDHCAAFSAAIDADFSGRPVQETELLELYPSLAEIRHALRHGRRWMRAQSRWAGFPFFPARNRLLPQPLGVVGIIAPWNYPLNLAVCPLASALVAGNRAMLKLSEHTPAFAQAFTEQLERRFDPEEVRVINGDAGVAQTFSRLPFDHLLFTGSTAVGTQVMRAASEHLTPVTLELGGKSPVLIAPGARLPHAVDRVLVGKLLNAGQTCVAPDYVLLPEADIPHFIELARQRVARMYPDLPNNRQYAAIINERHCQRLLGLRDRALADGASAITLGIDPGMAAMPFNGRRLAPTLLLDTTPQMDVMREEIFGPLLPLVGYRDFAEALRFVRDRPHPLAMYLFDDDRKRVEHVIQTTTAGGVCVNDTLYHVAQHSLPFGGVGPSGMGSYHGVHGFNALSHHKPVFEQARLNGAGLLTAPYQSRFQRMMRLLIGRG